MSSSTSTSNLVAVSDAPHFRSLLSADLTRVSLINFWAPWASPCTQMNAVVAELAKKHPGVLALNVEAEEQADIAESFDIEAVPSFVILRGHTLLARIAGADASALTQAIAAHAAAPVSTYAPKSHTDAAPPAAHNGDYAAPENETSEELDARLRRLMTQTKVVLFMKGTPDEPRCGFSRKLSTLLKEQGVQFSSFDILRDEDVRQGACFLRLPVFLFFSILFLSFCAPFLFGVSFPDVHYYPRLLRTFCLHLSGQISAAHSCIILLLPAVSLLPLSSGLLYPTSLLLLPKSYNHAGLKKLNDWPTFPQLIVNGELVGGLDIVQEMVDTGEFKEVVGGGGA
ncbi:thioredoxin-like protein [Mycena capillaripes]|nr:thioredoxin-like protein [Mycena capillaripes]